MKIDITTLLFVLFVFCQIINIAEAKKTTADSLAGYGAGANILGTLQLFFYNEN